MLACCALPLMQLACVCLLLPPACRSYANAHTYHINSIALSSDCETFISADDLRVNLWHLERCPGPAATCLPAPPAAAAALQLACFCATAPCMLLTCACRAPGAPLPALRCRQDQAFNIVDIKPQNMEDLTEVRGCC